jgi:hypothetical protein
VRLVERMMFKRMIFLHLGQEGMSVAPKRVDMAMSLGWEEINLQPRLARISHAI